MKKVYRLQLFYRIQSFLITFLITIGMSYFYFSEGINNASFVVFGIFLIIFVAIALDNLYYKVIINDQEVTIESFLKKIKLSFNQIERIAIIPKKSILVYPKDKKNKVMSIPIFIEQKNDLIQWLNYKIAK